MTVNNAKISQFEDYFPSHAEVAISTNTGHGITYWETLRLMIPESDSLSAPPSFMKYDSDLYARPALVTSEPLAWRGLRVERHQLEAMELPPHYHEHHMLLLYQGATPVTTRRKQGSQVQEAVFRTGNVGIYPGGEYDKVSWNGPTDTIHLYIDDQYLDQVARQAMDISKFGLRDQFRFDDPFLSQLGQQLLSAVGASHALGQLYVESLTNALCYHLIEHHATYERRNTEGRKLPDMVLNRIDAYLDAYIDQPLTLETLAELAHLSVFHFARLFKRTTGVSPYHYVLTRKIRRAQQLLRLGDVPIADISDALGFASPTHFSAAFKRAVGMSPTAYQRG